MADELVFESIEPNEVSVENEADVTVTIKGQGFTPDTVVIWGGTPDTSTFVDDTTITTVVKTSLNTNPAVVQVALQDTVTTTETLPFVFVSTTGASPLIATVTPDHAWFTDPPLMLMIVGGGFLDTSEVLWGGSPMANVVFVNDTNLQAPLDPSTATYDGNTMTAEIRVNNAGVWSNGYTFRFEQIQPATEGSTDYLKPDPPDVYQRVVLDTAWPPNSRATGRPTSPELPTTNAYPDGGLPMRVKEPYPLNVPPFTDPAEGG